MLRTLLFASLLFAAAAPASAQDGGFRILRYQAPPSIEDGLALQLPRTLGENRWSAQVVIDWAHAPLVLAEANGGREEGAIVSSQLVTHLGFAYGIIDRFEVFATIPIVLSQSGDGPTLGGTSFDEPSSTTLADPAIGGSARLVGEDDLGFQLGGALAVLLPLGSDTDYTGDGGIGVRASLLPAFVLEKVTLTANVGVSYRPDGAIANVENGPELLLGAGVHLTPAEGLRLMAELHGSTALAGGAFSRLTSPLELLFGARYTLANGFTFGAGAGPGLTQAVGTPDVRVLATLGYAPPRPREVVEEPPPPAPTGPPPPSDRDRDGILDEADQCPDQPEDRDTFQDEDGCPDPDNDNDGILDAQDRCPLEPEVINEILDTDGCPDEVTVTQSEIRLPEPIQFEIDSDRILPVSFPTLQQVAAIMADHTSITVLSIEGHTSDEGSERHNRDLSRRRARAVVRWLTDNAVSQRRLRWEGYGVSRPLVPNDSEENRRRNRRVEFRIVEQQEVGAP